MVNATRAFVLLLPLWAACGQRGEPGVFWTTSDDQQASLVGITDASGTTRFLHRVDSSIEHVVRGGFTGSEEQFAILTGAGSGFDQGCLILLGHDGRRLARYVCSGLPPDATDSGGIAPIQGPYPPAFQALVRHDRRLIVFTSIGDLSPSALVVLEATGRAAVAERLACWHRGHLHHVAYGDGVLAALGLSNTRKDEHGAFGAGLIVVDLDELLAAPESAGTTRVMPQTSGATLSAPVRYYVELPRDARTGAYSESVRIAAGRVYARMLTGATFILELATGDIRVEVSREYVEAYHRRREREPELPPTPGKRLDQLRAQVVVHRR